MYICIPSSGASGGLFTGALGRSLCQTLLLIPLCWEEGRESWSLVLLTDSALSTFPSLAYSPWPWLPGPWNCRELSHQGSLSSETSPTSVLIHLTLNWGTIPWGKMEWRSQCFLLFSLLLVLWQQVIKNLSVIFILPCCLNWLLQHLAAQLSQLSWASDTLTLKIFLSWLEFWADSFEIQNFKDVIPLSSSYDIYFLSLFLWFNVFIFSMSQDFLFIIDGQQFKNYKFRFVGGVVYLVGYLRFLLSILLIIYSTWGFSRHGPLAWYFSLFLENS